MRGNQAPHRSDTLLYSRIRSDFIEGSFPFHRELVFLTWVFGLVGVEESEQAFVQSRGEIIVEKRRAVFQPKLFHHFAHAQGLTGNALQQAYDALGESF